MHSLYGLVDRSRNVIDLRHRCTLQVRVVGQRAVRTAQPDNGSVQSIKGVALRKELKGKKVGTFKDGDAVMVRAVEAWKAFKKADGKSLADQTIKNYATSFRKMLNEGGEFSANAYRAKAGTGAKKGAKQKGSVVPDVKVILSGEPDEAFVAKKLREIFNGWKKKEKNLSLVGYLLDGLDDFEG